MCTTTGETKNGKLSRAEDPMEEPEQPTTSTRAPAPSPMALETRLRDDKLPMEPARVASSCLTAFMTFAFGGITAIAAVQLVREPTLASLLGVAVLGSFTSVFGFLTWRWSRSLPPSKRLATPRERDEL
jgi:hypothetical protein